jgi:DNA-binding transcriptional ArsR family regulator
MPGTQNIAQCRHWNAGNDRAQTVPQEEQNYSTKWLNKVLISPIFNHMVDLHAHALDSIFHALGDATRRAMLRDLSRQERTVSQLAEPFDMSLAAASKHIKVLENAGLIRREVKGRIHFCRLEPSPLSTAHEWLAHYERFWTTRLDVLEQLLREEKRPDPAQPQADSNKRKPS